MGKSINYENRESINVYVPLHDNPVLRKELGDIQQELCIGNEGVAKKAIELYVEWGKKILLELKSGEHTKS